MMAGWVINTAETGLCRHLRRNEWVTNARVRLNSDLVG